MAYRVFREPIFRRELRTYFQPSESVPEKLEGLLNCLAEKVSQPKKENERLPTTADDD